MFLDKEKDDKLSSEPHKDKKPTEWLIYTRLLINNNNTNDNDQLLMSRSSGLASSCRIVFLL